MMQNKTSQHRLDYEKTYEDSWLKMHLGLIYANCATGAQNKTIGDFFCVCVVKVHHLNIV